MSGKTRPSSRPPSRKKTSSAPASRSFPSLAARFPSRLALRAAAWGTLAVVVLVGLNAWVGARTRPHLYDRLADVPAHRVGVVLGTSPRLRGGGANPFFEGRMDAAAGLWRAGKVGTLVLSGDGREPSYDEPRAMRDALVARGVPESVLRLDRRGLRTLDSMVRTRDEFGARSFVVVSQRFHNERAVYIARHLGLDAVGYDARDVAAEDAVRTGIREVLARVQMLLDLYVLRHVPGQG